MKLTVLGSGVFKPRTVRYPSGLALTVGAKTIIFDAGSGTFMRLIEAGIDYEQIDYIFITHLHIDHTSDLLQYLWAYHLDRQKDLHLFGPAGLKKFYEHLTKLASQFSHLSFEVKIKEVDEGDAISLPFCEIDAIRTPHVDELVSICYKVKANQKIFGYSGDTGYSEKLIQFFKGAEVLVLECTTLNEQPVKGHLIPRECAEIAKKAEVKKLVLTHLDLDLEKVKEQCSGNFGGEIIVAEDLMQVEV
ncbi:MAG: MBL fold metallo-hydrolase [bacterium]